MNKIHHINRKKEIKELREELEEIRNNWLPFCFNTDGGEWSARDEERAIEREIKALERVRAGRATKAVLEVYNVDKTGFMKRVIIANKRRVVAVLKMPLNLFQKQIVIVVLQLGRNARNVSRITIKTQITGELC